MSPTLPAASVNRLSDKTWWAIPNRSGKLLTGPRLTLPDAERPVAVSDGYLASVQFGKDDGPGTPLPATVRVRRVPTGEVLAKAEFVRGVDLTCAMTQTEVFLIAYDEPPSAGLYALSIPDGALRTVVTPDGLQRSALHISPSGATLALLAADDDLFAELVDIASSSRKHLSVGGIPIATSDRQVFVSDSTSLQAINIETGDIDWTLVDTYVQRGYATSDGSTLVVQVGFEPFTTSPHGLELSPANLSNSILIVDAASGAQRIAATWDWRTAPQLWLAASSDVAAVVVADARDGIPVSARNPITVGVVDIASASLVSEPATVTL